MFRKNFQNSYKCVFRFAGGENNIAWRLIQLTEWNMEKKIKNSFYVESCMTCSNQQVNVSEMSDADAYIIKHVNTLTRIHSF